MNAPATDLLEPLLRAAVAALCGLMAVQFARAQPRRIANVTGVLFCAGIASYALVSGPQLAPSLGAVREPLTLLAALASAFFWWFALALFRDNLQWRLSFAVPLLILLVFYGIRRGMGEQLRTLGALGHQVTVAILLLHVLSMAVRDFHNDLMDSRRRFRLAVALLLPTVGLAIAAAETYAMFRPLPGWIGLLHACVLLGLAGMFALWLTSIKPDLMVEAGEAGQRPDALPPADAIELESLRATIAGGVCLEPDLSLGTLAARLKIPEHRLRRLINKGLGYRNFAAFVNDHRVTQAKRMLADPENAREQIVAVAFELGYGSLAPFNRAFRLSTGMTPSEYRAKALARVVDSRKS
jgi:AraC-like DNA-binding protein